MLQSTSSNVIVGFELLPTSLNLLGLRENAETHEGLLMVRIMILSMSH